MLTERLTKARHSTLRLLTVLVVEMLINALKQNDWKHEDIVNFAVASSVMKHASRGDTNITSVGQIKRLMNNASFDVQR